MIEIIKEKEVESMFKKINPYLREELTQEAAAHLCGCRCVSNSGTVGNAISMAISGKTCVASCKKGNSDNKNANLSEARHDKKWS